MGWIGGDQPSPIMDGDDTPGLLARLQRLGRVRRHDDPPFAVLLAVVTDFEALATCAGSPVAVGLVDDLVAQLRESWFGSIYRCGDDRFAAIARTGRGDADPDLEMKQRAVALEDAACGIVARHAGVVAALDVRVVLSSSLHDGRALEVEEIWCRALRLAGGTQGHEEPAPEPEEPKLEPSVISTEAELVSDLDWLDEVVAPPERSYGLVFVGTSDAATGSDPSTDAIVQSALGSSWPLYRLGSDDVVVIVPPDAPASPGEVARRVRMAAGQHPDTWVGDPRALLVLCATAWDPRGHGRRFGNELLRELQGRALIERLQAAEERVAALTAELDALTRPRVDLIAVDRRAS